MPVWIELLEAIALHGALLARHGGADGIRDKDLLQAALARPRQYAAYASRSDIIGMAARYTAGMVQNHPFVDGNKRIGFLLGALFLELNGHAFHARQEEAASAVIALASGDMDVEGYAAFLKANSSPA